MAKQLLQNLALRSQLLRAVRDFFYRHDFIETETAVRIAAPAPEEYIEAVPSLDAFLRTSPELEMKCLLAKGAEKIFQIGSCFRLGEYGRKHRQEFTMLEYYAAGYNYLALASFTHEMLRFTVRELTGGEKITYLDREIDFSQVEYITVDDAFRRYAGISAFEADRQGDIFDELMVTKVEPELGNGKITFLMDYPAARASLSRISPDDPLTAQRWEMYISGMELANAFGELTDADEQKSRFKASAAFREARNMAKYPEAVEFMQALDSGLPESSGCALGMDRLAMIFCNADDIGMVRA